MPTESPAPTLGLSEQRLREEIEEHLLRSMHVEGDRLTAHAIAHAVARAVQDDHLRMVEQLARAGVGLTEDAVSDNSE